MPKPLPIAFATIQRQPQTVTPPRPVLPMKGLLVLVVAGIIVTGFLTYRSPGLEARPGTLASSVLTDGKPSVIGYDTNNDGRTDSWTYLSDGHMVRSEVDDNGDGEIDRWFYYDQNQQLSRVETSSRAVGVLDDAPPMVEPNSR